MSADPSTLDSIRTSYDRVAGAYAADIYDELKASRSTASC
jgi:hypothetical protein